MAVFVWSWIVYRQMTEPPVGSMEVRVMAQSWSWNFQYDDGRMTQNQLFVPVNQPVKLVMTSKMGDVLHSFFIPNMRVKQDVVPGAYSYIWFKSSIVGQHQIFCTEFCGTGHSAMLAKLIVLSDEDYKLWKWGKEIKLPPVIGLGDTLVATAGTSVGGANKAVDPVLAGKNLMAIKGCVACHSDNGAVGVGPSHKGIFGSQAELTTGQKVLVDESYIRESIEYPQAKIVKGFEVAAMPAYKGQLSDDEIGAIIAYIKSLK
jgi:cytochrome c oxidase subunit 2